MARIISSVLYAFSYKSKVTSSRRVPAGGGEPSVIPRTIGEERRSHATLTAVTHSPGGEVTPTRVGIRPFGWDFEHIAVHAVEVLIPDEPRPLKIGI